MAAISEALVAVDRDPFDLPVCLLGLRQRHGQDAIFELRLRLVFLDPIDRDLPLE